MNNHQYTVSQNTCALVPAKEVTYGTTIIEHEKTIMEEAMPLEIIKESCAHYWSDYDGRRKAVIEKLQYKQKTPIPVSVAQRLCFFPTHSPTHLDNAWINYEQIRSWAEIPKEKRKGKEQIEVIFKNLERITLNVSRHTFRTQQERAFRVMDESGMILKDY